MKYDFVAFGDIVIDAFIKLSDAEEIANHGVRELCVRFGEKVPFESVTEVLSVGNAPNAAVAVHKVGLTSGLVVHVGDDLNGQRCIDDLKNRGIDTALVSSDTGFKTNYHYVLQFGPERTILVKHELYPYTLPAFDEAPAWFYLTSLPLETLDYQLTIAEYAQKNGVKLAFQPGTFQIKLGKEKLAAVYAATEVFFCNKEEAQTILGSTASDIKELMAGIKALGPKIVVVTDGPNGANILSDEGMWHVPMYPDPAPPVSRTGAGDATASTTIAYLQKGLPVHEALMRGMINAASVVQGVGAQTKLLTGEEIETWYAHKPTEFTAVPL
ncbi:MAG: hypothetical protein RLZZ342_435 [Candidatus Parcubacteria bacterium]|jgi:sugar/nucleoside kinase (ribokinase family)